MIDAAAVAQTESSTTAGEMMMFELTTMKAATLISVANRSEHHGDEKKPAVSIGLAIETGNTILDSLMPGLRSTLYTTPGGDAQATIDDVETATTVLRVTGIDSISLKKDLVGWTLCVDHGIDAEAPITIGACKVDSFRVAPKEGGTVRLSFRINSIDIDAHRLGLIGVQIGQEVSVTLTAPQAGQEQAGAAAESSKRQAKQERAGQRRIDELSDEDLIAKAREHVIETQTASITSLQKSLGIGIARATKAIKDLEDAGVVSPPNDANRRSVLVKSGATEEFLRQQGSDPQSDASPPAA